MVYKGSDTAHSATVQTEVSARAAGSSRGSRVWQQSTLVADDPCAAARRVIGDRETVPKPAFLRRFVKIDQRLNILENVGRIAKVAVSQFDPAREGWARIG